MIRTASALALISALAHGAQTPAAPTPILKLDFDDSASLGTAADSSGRGHHGVVLPGATLAGGRWNGGLLIDASGGVRVRNNADFDLNKEVTVCAWIRVDDASQDRWMRIVSKKPNYSAKGGFELEYNPAQKLVTLSGGYADFCRSVKVDLNAGWHHVAATIKNGQPHIFVDGVDVTVGNKVGRLDFDDGDLYIGQNPSGFARFCGAIDDVRIFNVELTADQIRLIAFGAYRMVGSWSFDEGSGLVAADASGLGNDGVLLGATWTAGLLGTAASLPGDGAVMVGVRPTLALAGQLTISAVVKVADPDENAFMRIVSSKAANTDTTGYELDYNPSLNLLSLTAANGDYARADNVDLDTGWHSIVAIVDGRNGRILVDGVDRTVDRVLQPLVSGATPFAIGRLGGVPFGHWHGAIDQVMIFNWAIVPATPATISPVRNVSAVVAPVGKG